jgi:hypothetical protein
MNDGDPSPAFLYSPSQVRHLTDDGTAWIYTSANHVAASLFNFNLAHIDQAGAPAPAISPPPAAPPPPLRLSDESTPLGWSWAPAPPIRTTVVVAPSATVESVSSLPPVYPYLDLALATAEALVLRVLLRSVRWLQGRRA